MVRFNYKPLPPFTKRQIEIFWSKVEVRGPDECWPWRGDLNKCGYGRVNLTQTKTSTTANRVAYILTKGPLAVDEQACHSCDIRYPKGSPEHRKCCNPAHLFAGTAAVNYADMRAKGRGVDPKPPRAKGDPGLRGMAHPMVKLTDGNVHELRSLSAGGETRKELAKRYGVSVDLIRKIVLRKLWKHL